MTFAWWFHKSSSDQTAFLQSQCVERERESQPWLLRNLQSVIEEANVRIVKLQPEAWLLDNPCTNNCQHGWLEVCCNAQMTPQAMLATWGQRLRHHQVAQQTWRHHGSVGLVTALLMALLSLSFTLNLWSSGIVGPAVPVFRAWGLWAYALFACFSWICSAIWRRSYGLTKRLSQHQNPDVPPEEVCRLNTDVSILAFMLRCSCTAHPWENPFKLSTCIKRRPLPMDFLQLSEAAQRSSKREPEGRGSRQARRIWASTSCPLGTWLFYTRGLIGVCYTLWCICVITRNMEQTRKRILIYIYIMTHIYCIYIYVALNIVYYSYIQGFETPHLTG